jgi:hypothetical protein
MAHSNLGMPRCNETAMPGRGAHQVGDQVRADRLVGGKIVHDDGDEEHLDDGVEQEEQQSPDRDGRPHWSFCGSAPDEEHGVEH